jgi:ferredoxin-type protein NapH
MISFKKLLPLLIGIAVSFITYFIIGWWGFWLIFTWVGGSITLGLSINTE